MLLRTEDWHGKTQTATIQFAESDTKALLEKFNPPVKGFDYPYTIKKISVDQDMLHLERAGESFDIKS